MGLSYTFDILFFKYFFTSVGNSQVCFILTLNIGRTCSKWVALVKFDWTWLTLSIKALAVVAMCSISTLYSNRRCLSLVISPINQPKSSYRKIQAFIYAKNQLKLSETSKIIHLSIQNKSHFIITTSNT